MDKTIVLSTHNKGKLAEFEGLAKRLGFRIITRDEAGIPHDFDVVEDGTTFEENSYKNAYEVMKMCGLPTMADDSGLMVDALDGQPGVYSSRFGGVEGDAVRNYTKLLDMMKDLRGDERKAHFTTVITLIYPDGKIRILDLDELSEAFEKRLIDETQLKKALTSLGNLMDAIYENSISALEAPIIKALSQNSGQ